jgi:SET domain-containing protein
LLLVKTEVRKSEIEGIGLFFLEDIKKGQILWRFHNQVDRIISDYEVNSCPEIFKEYIDKYAYRDLKTGLWVLCGDNARFINHSNNANVTAIESDLFTIDIANRDIKAGEEYTANYSEWDSKFDPTLYN